jgi:hypothetical protein
MNSASVLVEYPIVKMVDSVSFAEVTLNSTSHNKQTKIYEFNEPLALSVADQFKSYSTSVFYFPSFILVTTKTTIQKRWATRKRELAQLAFAKTDQNQSYSKKQLLQGAIVFSTR